MPKNKVPATLEELRDQICEQAEFVGSRGYAHNIIALCLRMIEDRFGRAEANRAIVDFGLDKLGWHVLPEEEASE